MHLTFWIDMIFIIYLVKAIFTHRGSLHPPCYSFTICLTKSDLSHLDSHISESNPLTYSASSLRIRQWAHMLLRVFNHISTHCSHALASVHEGQRMHCHSCTSHSVLCMSACSGFTLSKLDKADH